MKTERTRRLLYAEDEVLIQVSVEAALREAGFDLLIASDGVEALSLLESRHGEIGGLVTDVRLGRGLDCWHIARRARELAPRLPVVYATGGCSAEWLLRAVPLSVIIEKPFDPTQIIAAMAELLKGSLAETKPDG